MEGCNFFFYLWSRTRGLLSELLPQTKNFALLKVRYYRPNVKVWNTSYTKFGFVFIRKRDGYWQPISLAWPGKQSFCLQYYTKFECSYFLDLEKKWSPSPLLSFWKKTRPKGFYTIQKKFLHKENSYNKFSFCNLWFFLLCKHLNFSHLRNNVSANNGVKYLPHTFLLRLSFDVKKYKFRGDWHFRSFALPPSLPCPMIFSLQPNNVSEF